MSDRNDPQSSREDARRRTIAICGLAVVQAQFARRPGSLQRLFYTEALRHEVGPVCKALAGKRRPYRMVDADELERLSGTLHHGDVVAIIDEPSWHEVRAADLERWARAGEPVLVLDRIGNPHNLGAIVRSAAFFGVRRLVLDAGPEQARPSSATWRTARGGMAFVDVSLAADLPALCGDLRAAGYEVLATSVHEGQPMDLSRPPGRSGRPAAIVLGNEEVGLAPQVVAAADRRILIPGSGDIESLNVSAAAAVLLAWLAPRRT